MLYPLDGPWNGIEEINDPDCKGEGLYFLNLAGGSSGDGYPSLILTYEQFIYSS